MKEKYPFQQGLFQYWAHRAQSKVGRKPVCWKADGLPHDRCGSRRARWCLCGSGSGVGMGLPGEVPWAPWHHGLRSFLLELQGRPRKLVCSLYIFYLSIHSLYFHTRNEVVFPPHQDSRGKDPLVVCGCSPFIITCARSLEQQGYFSGRRDAEGGFCSLCQGQAAGAARWVSAFLPALVWAGQAPTSSLTACCNR